MNYNTTKKKNIKKKKDRVGFWAVFSWFLIASGLIILALIFTPPLFQEAKYTIEQKSKIKNQNLYQDLKTIEIEPVDTDFGIIIPKIGANAKIFPNIDPFNKKEFLPVLKKGVAHAKGTSFPGSGKNIYLFAHSTDAFFNVGRYNAVFYLIGKLEIGDKIDIYYKGQLFKYFVFEKKVVSLKAIEYLKTENKEVLTLQTCYPPGTTLWRLIVQAKLVN